MSLLLLLHGASSGGPPPAAGSKQIIITLPDECGIGSETRILAEYVDFTTTYPFDATPQIHIFKYVAGVWVDEVAVSNMTQVGVTDTWYYDWTPSEAETFAVLVAGQYGAADIMGFQPISTRSKIDPLALADADVLVSRF